MIIPRLILPTILEELQRPKGKGIVIYGPRQVGKTTLVTQIINVLKKKTLTLNGDQYGPWQSDLTSRSLSKITLLVSGYEVLFVDEAQRIPEIGLALKIILDHFPALKVVVTGSSSLDLASKISEPLTGRVFTYHLFPISQGELASFLTPYEREAHREEQLIFGSYPEIFSLPEKERKITYLRNLTDAYLYKDLLEFGDIRNSGKIRDLLKLIAFQIGSEVSLSELAGRLQINRATVERYIDLLEKSFIIFRLSGFNRNLRKEVTKMDKIYFYDTGIRNTIIGNLHSISDRDDAGKLWENFLIIERMKRQFYHGVFSTHYFWRLYTGAELDLVEETNGSLTGFEFKLSSKTAKTPRSWKEQYPNAQFQTINRENWQSFV